MTIETYHRVLCNNEKCANFNKRGLIDGTADHDEALKLDADGTAICERCQWDKEDVVHREQKAAKQKRTDMLAASQRFMRLHTGTQQ